MTHYTSVSDEFVSRRARAPKLCYLADANSPHTSKWVNHFSDKEYEVHLLSFEEPRDVSLGVNFHKLGVTAVSSLRYFTAVTQVRRILARVQPDLLHAHYASGYGTLGRLCGFHPYILSVWGSDVFEFPSISPVHRWLIKKNLSSANRVCSTSRFMADHVQQYYRGPITLTPFGVDCSRFKPKQPSSRSDEFVIGTVKLLEEKYGLEYLIRSFALLSKRCGGSRKLRLVIAGKGSLRQKLGDLAVACGVSGQTDFLGFIPPAEVPNVLNTFSVFTALSVADSESFGVAIVEASACGLPVVVSDAGGLPEVVKNGVTGMLVPRRNPEAVAAAISSLIEDEERRRTMGMAGRNLVLSQYEWTENASRMERLYASLLSARCKSGFGEKNLLSDP